MKFGTQSKFVLNSGAQKLSLSNKTITIDVNDLMLQILVILSKKTMT